LVEDERFLLHLALENSEKEVLCHPTDVDCGGERLLLFVCIIAVVTRPFSFSRGLVKGDEDFAENERA